MGSLTENIKILDVKLKNHIEKFDSGMSHIDSSIQGMRKDIRGIKDNHLKHFQEEISDIKTEVKGVKTNINWLMKFQWVIISSIVGGFIANIGTIIYFIVTK